MRLRKTLKVAAWCLAAIMILCAVLLAMLKARLDATYFNGYNPTAPLDPRITKTVDGGVGRYTQFHYKGFRAEETPALLALPKEGQGPFPCIVFLHGFLDDKDYMARNRLDEPFLKAGFAFATFDQLMSGERKIPKDASPLQRFNALRRRAAFAVNDARRMIDYLKTREDIASGRIYLAGFSFGGVTGVNVMALDPRIRAAVFLCAGGRLPHMLTSKTIADELGAWRLPAQALAWFFWGAFDPVKRAPGIAPRPVLLFNGAVDTAMNPRCAKALHDALGEPKILRWYQGEHLGLPCEGVDMKSTETRVLNEAIEFLLQQDAQHPATASVNTPPPAPPATMEH